MLDMQMSVEIRNAHLFVINYITWWCPMQVTVAAGLWSS